MPKSNIGAPDMLYSVLLDSTGTKAITKMVSSGLNDPTFALFYSNNIFVTNSLMNYYLGYSNGSLPLSFSDSGLTFSS